jgi:MYXO-CTERM domain-containing protein
LLKKVLYGFLAIAITFTLLSELNVNAQITNQINKVIYIARDNNLNNDVNYNLRYDVNDANTVNKINDVNPVNDNLRNDVNDVNTDSRGNNWAWLGLLGLVGLIGLRRRPEKR